MNFQQIVESLPVTFNLGRVRDLCKLHGFKIPENYKEVFKENKIRESGSLWRKKEFKPKKFNNPEFTNYKED